MNRHAAFSLEVQDVFSFADGRTVFVGKLDTDASYVRPARCELIVDDHVLDEFDVEGEMMPTPRKPEMRSISTSALLRVDLATLRRPGVFLRSLE